MVELIIGAFLVIFGFAMVAMFSIAYLSSNKIHPI